MAIPFEQEEDKLCVRELPCARVVDLVGPDQVFAAGSFCAATFGRQYLKGEFYYKNGSSLARSMSLLSLTIVRKFWCPQH